MQSLIIKIIIVLALVGSGLAFVKFQSKHITELQASLSDTQNSLKEKDQELNTLLEQVATQRAALQTLSKQGAESQALAQELSDKLIRHDLEELSRVKPGLVTTRINNGTKQIFDSISDITQ